jgi:predicted nucleotidyltransferase
LLVVISILAQPELIYWLTQCQKGENIGKVAVKVIMKREDVLAILAAHKDNLKGLGVKSLDLFGSVARDEARPDSDVDFLVEFSIEASLFDLFRVQHYLEDLLGCAVDLGTEDALREHLREPVLKEAIRAF